MANDSIAIIQKLQRIAHNAIQNKDYEKALTAVAAGGNILYAHNQTYTDDTFEQQLLTIEASALKGVSKHFETDPKTVLFYDGFGLDTRGLALIFLKALTRIGYRVIYVTTEQAIDKQPNIRKAVEGYPVVWNYIDTKKSYLHWAAQICDAFVQYTPQHAFFYTSPNDVSAAVAFAHFSGTVTRYQIDLTDHAFWLGIHAFDYCVALRDVGAKIAFHYRNVPKEKIVMLPYYPTIDFNAEFQGFPFDATDRKVIFSGGALYKTLGDKNNTYYKIAGALLEKHPDVIFLYAGFGDDIQLKQLAQYFPERVYHIAERKDLYQVMKNSDIYLNTYPMFGGLMMHYAAAAGKLPLTLKHGHDADGLLFNQASIGIEYDTMEDLLDDADRLLTDPAYLKEREARLDGCVITERRFETNLQRLLCSGETEFSFSLDKIDTEDFRAEYDRRFRYHQTVRRAIAAQRNKPLRSDFPLLFLQATCVRKIKTLRHILRRGE